MDSRKFSDQSENRDFHVERDFRYTWARYISAFETPRFSFVYKTRSFLILDEFFPSRLLNFFNKAEFLAKNAAIKSYGSIYCQT